MLRQGIRRLMYIMLGTVIFYMQQQIASGKVVTYMSMWILHENGGTSTCLWHIFLHAHIKRAAG